MVLREHPGDDVTGSKTAMVNGYTERTKMSNVLHVYIISRPYKVTFGLRLLLHHKPG